MESLIYQIYGELSDSLESKEFTIKDIVDKVRKLNKFYMELKELNIL